MFNELKEIFEDDYIRTKWFRAKPFTLLWWMIRGGQAMLGVAGVFWILYADVVGACVS